MFVGQIEPIVTNGALSVGVSKQQVPAATDDTCLSVSITKVGGVKMTWFDNLSLRGKLFINFLISGGVLIAAIVFCLIQLRAVGDDTNEIAKNWLPSVQVAGEISQLRLRYRVRSLEYMQSTSEDEKKAVEKSLGDLDSELVATLKKYEPLVSSNAEKAAYEQAVKGVADYRATVHDAIALVKAGKESEAQQLRRTT